MEDFRTPGNRSFRQLDKSGPSSYGNEFKQCDEIPKKSAILPTTAEGPAGAVERSRTQSREWASLHKVLVMMCSPNNLIIAYNRHSI